jgi:cellobiose-specific phosphotransferase system component IIA
MLQPLGNIAENLLDPFEDLGRFTGGVLERVESAGEGVAGLFGDAVGLAEGYASRAGIMTRPAFALLDVPATFSGRGSDRDFDGLFVGAGGRTYAPSTPLAQVPGVVPSDGRAPVGTVVYVNGINTTRDGQFGSLQQIADRTGARVVGIHNATQGGFVDLIQSAGDTLDIGHNPAVDTLADTVYQEITSGRTIHLMAHSQGALITSRALSDVYQRLRVEDGLSRREAERMLSRVEVETFGGAAGSYPDGPRYVHYVNRRDAVPALFGLGPVASPLVHPGRGAVVRRFSERHNAHGFEETYLPRRVPFERARRGDFD